jgi:hypothetical protein
MEKTLNASFKRKSTDGNMDYEIGTREWERARYL